ncbi:helix-turn-helix transcriptional regulator [Nocardia neocaledoniensis]|uniref:helix-turn-helix transcriptional regulator n=1 Tax=Nocardia neocaledoniensis TaxID=236511 RepID=UPI0024549D65|nr:AraC family transcriptional regulator [Nocardia neocaledoniensis]
MAIEPTILEFSSSTSLSEAREQWEALMSETYVPLAVDTQPDQPFYGRVTSGSLAGPADFSLTTVAGSNQEFRRSKTHLSRSDDEYLLASIHTRGRACLHQDGRSAVVGQGDMVFYDTSKPYHWTNSSAFEQVVVQVPLRLLREQPGLAQVDLPTAVTVPADSAAGVVAGFFRGLARVRQEAPDQADVLAVNALDLVGSAVMLTAGMRPIETSRDSLNREQVLIYLREHCTNPELTADEVARACHISRRTLFRVFDGSGDSLGVTLRKLRVRHAKALLIRHRALPPAAVAFGSGFASERQFYRVFQRETGMTPGEFRHNHAG